MSAAIAVTTGSSSTLPRAMGDHASVAMPWARSVIVCALNYNAEAPRSIDPAPATAGWIARYAWSGKAGKGSDYHDVLLEKLHSVEVEVLARFGGETRCYVDTGPIVERDYAARAGVGWIGKNTCALNQKQGSWLLLGVIVTSLELEREAWPLPALLRREPLQPECPE